MNLKKAICYLQTIFEKYQGVGNEFDILKEDFLLVSFHPVTTEYNNLRKLTRNLLQALKKSKIKVIMLWPNADAGNEFISKEIRIYRGKIFSKLVILV